MTPLDALARTPRLLVALDFDGTLSPLVDEPLTARMTPEAADAVRALVRAPDTVVAFVSGRTLHDLRVIAEHGDDSAILLEASHGAEHWPADGAEATDPASLALRDRLRDDAGRLAEPIEGAWIEPKEFGFAVHTRMTQPDDARSLAEQVDALMAAEAPTWRRRQGHDILEYAFRAEGKDAAVARLRERTGATGVLFAGDDVTDEDALRSLGPDDVGVRVGPGATSATIRVDDITGLARLLVGLAHERAARRE